ncbi:MAG: 5-deoxy-glucuronate isomerase [Anaerolineaceae bacterium]
MTMRQYGNSSLVIHSEKSEEPDVIVEVLPDQVGWETIEFQVRRMKKKQSWSSSSGEKEIAVIILGGCLDVKTNRENWGRVGSRANVFSGLPHALYLPRATSFTFSAVTDCEFAVARVPVNENYPACLISPGDITVEIRGGDHATRQINNIIPPGFPCQRLVVVEVYTPGGNWSSYPPHKHDNRRVAEDGTLLEADLDEIYYYKFDKPEGFAIQRIYTGKDSPLQKANKGFDVSVLLKNNDVALVPEGYHPVSSPPGYMTYYLNILAGSDQALTASDDPDFLWVKNSYRSVDPRLPLYPIDQKR